MPPLRTLSLLSYCEMYKTIEQLIDPARLQSPLTFFVNVNQTACTLTRVALCQENPQDLREAYGDRGRGMCRGEAGGPES